MDRAKYNECMGPYIRGKEKTKAERQMGFCIGAKICSGKVKTEAEAVTVCNAPRLPKWAAAKEEPGAAPLSCEQKTARILETIVQVKDLIKSGKTEEIKAPLVIILQDIHACAPQEIQKLADDTLNEVKKTTGDYYFKGETREMLENLRTLEKLLGGE